MRKKLVFSDIQTAEQMHVTDSGRICVVANRLGEWFFYCVQCRHSWKAPTDIPLPPVFTSFLAPIEEKAKQRETNKKAVKKPKTK